MKYKLIYSLSFFALYGSVVGYLYACWDSSPWEGCLSLISAYFFYFLLKNRIYYAKEWIRSAIITFSSLLAALCCLEPFLAFGVGISYLGASFIQVYLDEMCRSKEI